MDRFSTFIAMRYLRLDRKNRFLSWIAILSIFGVVISVAAMIVVLSVINGFEVELRKRFLYANAHILLFKYPSGMNKPDHWVEAVQKDFGPHVTGVSPFVHYETMMRKGSIIQSVLVRGLAPHSRESVQSLKRIIHPHSALEVLQDEINAFRDHGIRPEVPQLIVGVGLLKILNAEVGDVVQVISPSENAKGEMKSFRVIGVYDSGLNHYDNKLVAMSLTTAQDFFEMESRVTGLEIGLNNPDDSVRLADEMSTRYALSVREWRSFNQPMFTAIEQEKRVIGVIVWLIAVVAGFNILMTILVSVTQKQREISVLKSLGATHGQVMLLFLKQGMVIGTIGSLLGIVLALGISQLLERYEFIELPDPYFLSTLPIEYDLLTYTWVPIAAIFLCLVSGLYPSLIAARVTPTEGFKGAGQGMV